MKEVIKQIQDMGFVVEVSNVSSTVLRNNKTVAWVVTYQPYSIDTTYDGFYELDYPTKEKLFNLLTQLYQEPKYYWVLKGLGELDDEMAILSELDGKYGIGMISVFGEPRTQFTKVEFEEIKEKLGFTLEFEPVGVE